MATASPTISGAHASPPHCLARARTEQVTERGDSLAMPTRGICKPNKKRASVTEQKKRSSITENMSSDAERILSAVDRGLIKLLDSDTDGVELNRLWADAPKPCVVAVNLARFNYIIAIKERLKTEGFFWDPHL
eukprot:4991080-Prymnesium_polylepis.1